jgi:hypothetical protein
MKYRIPKIILRAVMGLLFLWYAGGSGAQPILATGPDADVSEDGLHRVDPSIMDGAWVRPDMDLSQYKRILFMPVGVQFRDVRKRNYNVRTRATVKEFWISDDQKAQFREEWGQRFHEDLGEVESYELYEGVGRDVLVVQGFLMDVIYGVPPDLPGSLVGTVTDPWIVTVVLEIRDSMSNEILARTVDRRRSGGHIDATAVSALTPRLIQRWSQLLCRHLEALSDLSEH